MSLNHAGHACQEWRECACGAYPGATSERRLGWLRSLGDAASAAVTASLARVLQVRVEALPEADPCRAGFYGCEVDGAGVPAFSPHDLRHRRVSLLHLGGMPWARIGELVGHDDLMTTARTYTHVIPDERELAYERLLR